MKRILIFLTTTFLLTIVINAVLTVRTAEAPEAQQIIRKGDTMQLVDTPDGISLFGLTDQP